MNPLVRLQIGVRPERDCDARLDILVKHLHEALHALSLGVHVFALNLHLRKWGATLDLELEFACVTLALF